MMGRIKFLQIERQFSILTGYKSQLLEKHGIGTAVGGRQRGNPTAEEKTHGGPRHDHHAFLVLHTGAGAVTIRANPTTVIVPKRDST